MAAVTHTTGVRTSISWGQIDRHMDTHSNHDTGEVCAEDRVDNDKDVLVAELAEAPEETSREQPDEHLEVEEVRGPGGRLVLRDGGDDGHVDLGVASVPERVETSSPGCDPSREGKDDERNEGHDGDENDKRTKEELKLLARDETADSLDECDELDETEDTQSSHSLGCTNGEELDERDLHGCDCAEHIPARVGDIDAVVVTAHEDKDKDVQGKHVSDEDVSTPGGNHPAIEERSDGTPEGRSGLQRPDPSEESDHEEEDGNSLVIVGSSNRTGDVSGNDTDEGRGKQTS